MQIKSRTEVIHPLGEGEFAFSTPGGRVRLSVTNDSLTPFGWSAFSVSDAWLLTALCALSPALFLREGFDIGRFDQIGLVATLAAIEALDAGLFWVAGALAASALLVHEAFALIGLPLIGAYFVERSDHGERPLLPRLGSRRQLARPCESRAVARLGCFWPRVSWGRSAIRHPSP